MDLWHPDKRTRVFMHNRLCFKSEKRKKADKLALCSVLQPSLGMGAAATALKVRVPTSRPGYNPGPEQACLWKWVHIESTCQSYAYRSLWPIDAHMYVHGASAQGYGVL